MATRNGGSKKEVTSIACRIVFIACPCCGQMIMPNEIRMGKEPELLTTKCSHCQKIIEVQPDPVTGKLMAKEAKPS